MRVVGQEVYLRVLPWRPTEEVPNTTGNPKLYACLYFPNLKKGF